MFLDKTLKDINLPSLNQYYSLQNKNRVVKEDIFTFENGENFSIHIIKSKR